MFRNKLTSSTDLLSRLVENPHIAIIFGNACKYKNKETLLTTSAQHSYTVSKMLFDTRHRQNLTVHSIVC